MPSAMREDFLKNYLGSELDPLWLETVSKLTAKGAGRISWPATKTASRNYARKFAPLATDTGLDIGEFCKVVHTTPWDIAPTAPRE
jgi:RNA polymerase primary sigma factor